MARASASIPVDCRNLTRQSKDFPGGKCFCNGVEVKQCRYVDTTLGIAKTYDVLGRPQITTVLADGAGRGPVSRGRLSPRRMYGSPKSLGRRLLYSLCLAPAGLSLPHEGRILRVKVVAY
jgi:hypothetical protein